MHKRCLARLFLYLTLIIINTGVASAQIDIGQIETAAQDGSAWFGANQNPGGSWGEAISNRDTAVVIEALRGANASDALISTAKDWLTSTDSPNVDYLARKIGALRDLTDVAVDTNSLLAQQQTDGGFGLSPVYLSDPFDTALALKALVGIPGIDQAKLGKAAIYLMSGQNPDGGWSLVGGSDSSIKATALVLNSLAVYQSEYKVKDADLDAKINSAIARLISKQNQAGSWDATGSVHRTALSVSALSAAETATVERAAGVDYLLACQSPDGSWNQKPYDTALALLALNSNRLNVVAENMTVSENPARSGYPVNVEAGIKNLSFITKS